MTGYRNCKVGDVIEAKYADGGGYGFGITSDRGKFLVFLAFPTTEDAKQARADLANVVVKTTEITPGSGGQPTRYA